MSHKKDYGLVRLSQGSDQFGSGMFQSDKGAYVCADDAIKIIKAKDAEIAKLREAIISIINAVDFYGAIVADDKCIKKVRSLCIGGEG